MADKSLIGEHVCPECGKSFVSLQRVNAHRARTHGWRRNGEEPGPVEPYPQSVLDAVSEHQRPIDEEKVDEYKGEFLDSVQSSLFEDRVAELLPHLAYEAAKQLDQGETSLAQAFFILFLDAR